MKQLKKTLLTLVALLAISTGAWAIDPNAVTAAEINSDLYSGWSSIDGVLIKASELPGFQTVTEDQAKSWTGAPSTGTVELFYEFVADGQVKAVRFVNGVYDSSFMEEDLERNLIWEDIKYNDAKYFYTTGPAPTGPKVAWDKAEKTGTFTMPGGNVTLEPEYYPQAALTAAPTAINDVPATTDGAIVKAGTVANIGSTETAQGTVMYYVSQTALDDAALLALAADKWTADVPTAEKLTKGQAYVYYYVRGNDSDTDEENFSDGDILAANALTVTIAAEPTYAVTFAEGTDPNEWTADPNAGVKKGQTVTVTYTGTKKVIGVKAEKKAAAPAETTVTLTTGEIGDLFSWDSNSKTINGITIAVSGVACFHSTGLIDVHGDAGPNPDPDQVYAVGTFTFTSSAGKIKRIDINHNNGGLWYGAGEGWPGSYQVYDNSTFTWSGIPAASVTLNGSHKGFEFCVLYDVSSIVFTLEPTN